MSARRIMALLKSHIDGDTQQFYSTALQVAADEARQGHARIAKELRDLIDQGRSMQTSVPLKPAYATPISQPRGDLASMLSIDYPTIRLSNMVLDEAIRSRLERLLLEQRQSARLLAHDLRPRRKLLLTGPPGSGKTMTASAIAGELKLPLFVIRLEGVITKFLGETAQKILTLFDAMNKTQGVYLFDEFDALGAKRNSSNDIGEIRRILNSFLQLLEGDRSQSVIVCATNHPELLDRALFRRFDDSIDYRLPDDTNIESLLQSRLHLFDTADVNWCEVVAAARGLSQADVTRAAEESAKSAVLSERASIAQDVLITHLKERKRPSV
ncbi:MAG: AAA family ATPase [Bradyrhizobium sp.]|nr:AAA family ATPase [Bradyrhizobium sp.]